MAVRAAADIIDEGFNVSVEALRDLQHAETQGKLSVRTILRDEDSADVHEMETYTREQSLANDEPIDHIHESSPLKMTAVDHPPRKDTPTARPYRASSSRASITSALLDLCLVLPALYFLIFAFVVLAHDKTPTESDGIDGGPILVAASLGPTIFPIVFAGIIGRFLQAAASWTIERGATVAILEMLLGSKTVLSALALPINLRIFSFLTPLLIILWAISPIGGQASRRIVSVGPSYFSTPMNVSYFDTNSWYTPTAFSTENATGFTTFSAAYMAALVSPPDIKHGPRDVFGHVKVPMIEYLEPSGMAQEEFTPVSNSTNIAWSSLLGLPIANVNGSSGSSPKVSPFPASSNSSFDLQSSYFHLNCAEPTLRQYDPEDTSNTPWSTFSNDSNTVVITDGWIRLGLPAHSRNSTGARVIYFDSLGGGGVSHTKCIIETTYVESKVVCAGASCSIVAIKRSASPLMASNLTMLDYSRDGGSSRPEYGNDFFRNWLVTTPESPSSVWPTPNSAYFLYPDAPFKVEDNGASFGDLSQLDQTAFEVRFAQLLNTVYIAGVAPEPVTGKFQPNHRFVPPWVNGVAIEAPLWFSRYTTADVGTQQMVIICHRGWLAVLVVSSLVLLVACIVTGIMRLSQHGPDLLTSFSTLLRDSPYVQLEKVSSMDDGGDTARLWASQRVRLGDVNPLDPVGHIAIGMANGDKAAARLRKGRLYQ